MGGQGVITSSPNGVHANMQYSPTPGLYRCSAVQCMAGQGEEGIAEDCGDLCVGGATSRVAGGVKFLSRFGKGDTTGRHCGRT